MSATKAKSDAQPNGSAATTPDVPPAHEGIAEALVAAQTEMPAVDRDQTNPHFKSKFASLGNLLAKMRPVLNRHGIALVQMPRLDDEGRFVLQTKLLHTSGEYLVFDTPLNPTKNDPQGQGSAITYMRRYAAASALAIADQEDDDGEAGTARGQQQRQAPQATAHDRKPSERPINGEQKGKINARLAAANLTDAEASAVRVWFCAKHDCQHFDRLSSAQASNLIDELREDGAGARIVLDDLKMEAAKGHEVAAKVLERMQGAESA